MSIKESEQKMRFSIKYVVAIVLIVAISIACVILIRIKKDDKAVINPIVEGNDITKPDNSGGNAEGALEYDDSEMPISMSEGSDCEADNSACEDRFDAFLNGDGQVIIDSLTGGDIGRLFDEWDTYINPEPQAPRAYTLNELTEAVKGVLSSNASCSIGRVGYYLLDLGKDGKKELCLEMSDISAIDYESISFVIMEKENELKCVYCFVGMSRIESSITYDGIVTVKGSNGAGSHSLSEYVLNGDGTVDLIYSIDYNTTGWISTAAQSLAGIDDGLYAWSEKGYTVSAEILRFAGAEDSDFMLGIEVLDENYEPCAEGDENVDEIRKLFTERGFTLLSNEDIEAAIEQKRLSLGITGEMRNSFEKLEFVVLYE